MLNISVAIQGERPQSKPPFLTMLLDGLGTHVELDAELVGVDEIVNVADKDAVESEELPTEGRVVAADGLAVDSAVVTAADEIDELEDATFAVVATERVGDVTIDEPRTVETVDADGAVVYAKETKELVLSIRNETIHNEGITA